MGDSRCHHGWSQRRYRLLPPLYAFLAALPLPAFFGLPPAFLAGPALGPFCAARERVGKG